MIGIKVTGLAEFIEKVEKSGGQIKPTLGRGIKKSMFHLQKETIPRTNVDKGVLWNSYKIKLKGITGTLYNIRKYGVYVHEGTKTYKGNPFMTDTAEAESDKVNLIMNKEMHKYLSILK